LKNELQMSIVYACIVPHGSQLIPALCKNAKEGRLFAKSRQGVKKLSLDLGLASPDTIVVATPHNLRLWAHLCVVISENSSGPMKLPPPKAKKELSLRAACDLDLAWGIIKSARRLRLPVVGANYGASEGAASDLMMDWGTFVPLWYLLRSVAERNVRPKVVIATPSREIPIRLNFKFGQAISYAHALL
jgi:aromatic ring-opening dioxygenase LigB subunit